MSKSTYDVLIIGAEAAGLAASRVLTAAGLRVAIVEARNRIGGRILTRHEVVDGVGDVPVELGAEFVHGLPPSSWNVIREACLDTYELDGSQLCYEESLLQSCSSEQQQTFEILGKIARWLVVQPADTDLTFADYLLNRPISDIRWQSRRITVSGRDAAGDRFELAADQLVSTLPLGVLKYGAVNFEPSFPELARQASRRGRRAQSFATRPESAGRSRYCRLGAHVQRSGSATARTALGRTLS